MILIILIIYIYVNCILNIFTYNCTTYKNYVKMLYYNDLVIQTCVYFHLDMTDEAPSAVDLINNA